MLRMGLALACILVPAQLVFGHLVGDYIVKRQPSKITAIEGRWETQQPASEVIIGWPDEKLERNLFQIALPAPIGSLIDSASLTAKEIGLNDIPPADRPPVAIPFFTFRIMVGCGMLMLALAWGGMEQARWLLRALFFSFPLGFIATLTGWVTAEVGRQPWTVYGQIRTADAVTPFLTTPQVATSLTIFAAVYALIFIAGVVYIYRLLKAGIQPTPSHADAATNPKRPFSAPGSSPGVQTAPGSGAGN